MPISWLLVRGQFVSHSMVRRTIEILNGHWLDIFENDISRHRDSFSIGIKSSGLMSHVGREHHQVIFSRTEAALSYCKWSVLTYTNHR